MEDLETRVWIIKLCKEMEKLHKISVDFPILSTKNRLAVLYFAIMVKLSYWSCCVNKIGQILKFNSYSNR